MFDPNGEVDPEKNEAVNGATTTDGAEDALDQVPNEDGAQDADPDGTKYAVDDRIQAPMEGDDDE